MLLILILMAVCAPWVSQHDPNYVDLLARDQPPSWSHWLGTDRTGRDVFARTLYAGRVSLAIGFSAALISLLVGTTLGALAGFFGSMVDNIVMRITDVFMTFPSIVIILTVVALTGPGLTKTVLVIGLLNWPIPCRLVRARLFSVRNQDFMTAATVVGSPASRLIVRHALPNAIDVLVVYASFGVASAILVEAGLSFLGLGVQPPDASWGNMLNAARNLSVLENAPWQWIPAGSAVVLTVLATNFIGDGLRDALDPRMKI